LGGNVNQPLTNLPREAHQAFHSDLYRTLNKRGLPAANKSAEDWKFYMKGHAGSQKLAFDAVLESAKKIDRLYGTKIAADFMKNFRNGLYAKYK